eukprot:3926406-Pyramimonas_sp.AAC.1
MPNWGPLGALWGHVQTLPNRPRAAPEVAGEGAMQPLGMHRAGGRRHAITKPGKPLGASESIWHVLFVGVVVSIWTGRNSRSDGD